MSSTIVTWMGKTKVCKEEFSDPRRAEDRAKHLKEVLTPESAETVVVIYPPEKDKKRSTKQNELL